MTTRRDLIRLAGALGLAGTIPTSAERIAAAQILGSESSSRIMLDPGKFAQKIAYSVGNELGEFSHDWYGVVAPVEHAEYDQARERLGHMLSAHGIGGYRECGDYDAATLSLIMAMYDAGLRHGAAFENLRRSMVGEVVTCRACLGTGATYEPETGKVNHHSTCTTCGGTGTVAMQG